MAGFMDILGTLVQQGMAQSSQTRMGNAFGVNQGGGGGSLTDILGGLGDMLAGQGNAQPSSQETGGLGGVLGEVLGSLGGSQGGALGNLGALAGAIFGGGAGGRTNRQAVGGGTLAMLASLAIAALRKAGQQPASMPRSLYEPESEEDFEALEKDAEIIVKAMINAAKADGRIDDAEVKKIIGKLQEDGLTEEEKQFFLQEASKPLDLNEVIRLADNRPELAAQIYTASLLAIEVDTPAEQQYMQQLADGLGLDARVTGHIHQFLGM